MGNSIIDAQFDFFHDRTISEPEPLNEWNYLSTVYIPGLFPGKTKIDNAPVDKMYLYPIPDIVITFQDEVYRLATTLSEAEAKEAISELDQDDYPIYIKQKNPYSATHHVEYSGPQNYLDFLTKLSPWDETEGTTIRWIEQEFIEKERRIVS